MFSKASVCSQGISCDHYPSDMGTCLPLPLHMGPDYLAPALSLSPPPRHGSWVPTSHPHHLVVITGHLFKLVHVSTYPSNHTDTLVLATRTCKVCKVRKLAVRILLECCLVVINTLLVYVPLSSVVKYCLTMSKYL